MKKQGLQPKSRPLQLRSGFTLIEVIAGLALSAALIALMLPLVGSSLEGGRKAISDLPETQSLRSEMDALWQTYRTTYPNDLEGLRNHIGKASASADASKAATVLDNTWVDFDDTGAEITPEADAKNALRVTLGNAAGERLTAYFFPIE